MIENAWNSGVSSIVPQKYAHLFTFMDPKNVDTSAEEAFELSDFCGIQLHDVVAVKPERLLLHETFLRSMTRINIKDGEDYLVFGKNFRELVQTLMDEVMSPKINLFKQEHSEIRLDVSKEIETILKKTFFTDSNAHEDKKKSGISSLFTAIASWRKEDAQPVQLSDLEHINNFKTLAREADSPRKKSIYKNLAKVCDGIVVKFGRVVHNPEAINKVTTNMVCNEYGSYMLGKTLDQFMPENELQMAPLLKKPTIISLKGASASGKSTFRTLLNSKGPTMSMQESGLDTLDGFVLISPDVCRKIMIDFDGLGEATKYAGMLTSDELGVIDQKIDRYLREVVENYNALPNILIDRFRFDTFSAEDDERIAGFINKAETLHMCFIVTSPERIVERGYNRGVETGRYRSTEDFLALSIEAYKGMPKKFLQWLEKEKPDFKFEFYDNNVPKGDPLTLIAQGDRNYMEVYDIEALINLDRYQKVNIQAKNPDEIYPDLDAVKIENNLSFLSQCLNSIDCVEFYNPQTGEVYAESLKGNLNIINETALQTISQNEDILEIFKNLNCHIPNYPTLIS